MKKTIEGLARAFAPGARRVAWMLALALVLGATGRAVAMDATVVWQSDFGTATKTDSQGRSYTISLNDTENNKVDDDGNLYIGSSTLGALLAIDDATGSGAPTDSSSDIKGTILIQYGQTSAKDKDTTALCFSLERTDITPAFTDAGAKARQTTAATRVYGYWEDTTKTATQAYDSSSSYTSSTLFPALSTSGDGYLLLSISKTDGLTCRGGTDLSQLSGGNVSGCKFSRYVSFVGLGGPSGKTGTSFSTAWTGLTIKKLAYFRDTYIGKSDAFSYQFPTDTDYNATISTDADFATDITWSQASTAYSGTWNDTTGSAVANLKVTGDAALTIGSAVTVGELNLDIDSGKTVSLTLEGSVSSINVSGGGILSVGGATFSAPIAVAQGSTLQFAPTGAATVSGVISGWGNVVVSSGTVTFSAANTYTGTLTIKSGAIVKPGTGFSQAFGSKLDTAKVFVEAGGVLDINGVAGLTYVFNIAGDGTGNGAIVNTTTDLKSNDAQFKGLVLSANASICAEKNMGIVNSSYNAATLTLNGYKLTKKGANSLFMHTMTTDDGTIQVDAGHLLPCYNSNKAQNAFNCTVIMNNADSQFCVGTDGGQPKVKKFQISAGGKITGTPGANKTRILEIIGEMEWPHSAAPGITSIKMDNGTTLKIKAISELGSKLAVTSTDTVKVDVSALTLGTSTKVLTWSTAPEGKFEFADSSLDATYALYKESDGLYVKANPTVTDVAVEYYADYEHAKVTAEVTEGGLSGVTYSLKIDETVKASGVAASDGTVTFDNVDTSALGLGESTFTVVATYNSADVGTGAQTAEKGGTTDWFTEDSTHKEMGGAWEKSGTAYANGYVEIAEGDNRFGPASPSVGESVTVTTVVKFTAENSETIEGSAQAAIRVKDASTYQVLNNGAWVEATGPTPVLDADQTVVFTLNYGTTPTYTVSVGGTALSNADGATFALPEGSTKVSTIDFMGTGSVKSIAGRFVSAGIVVELDGTAGDVEVSQSWISRYLSDKTVSEAKKLLARDSGELRSNGYNWFANYALGLDPADATSTPKLSADYSGGEVAFGLNGVVVPEGVTLTVTAQQKGPSDAAFTDIEGASTTVVGNGEAASGTVSFTPSVESVKYYKLKITIGATK